MALAHGSRVGRRRAEGEGEGLAQALAPSSHCSAGRGCQVGRFFCPLSCEVTLLAASESGGASRVGKAMAQGPGCWLGPWLSGNRVTGAQLRELRFPLPGKQVGGPYPLRCASAALVVPGGEAHSTPQACGHTLPTAILGRERA